MDSKSNHVMCGECFDKANGYEQPKIKLTIKHGSNIIINTFGNMTIEICTKE